MKQTFEQRPKRPKRENPIISATRTWLSMISPSLLPWTEEADTEIFLQTQVPKRFTTYEPMVLLPSGSFTNTTWLTLLSNPDLDGQKPNELWHSILQNLSRTSSGQLTHLAVNEGIPLQSTSPGTNGGINILRSPSGLRLLYGIGEAEWNPSNLGTEVDHV